MNTQKMREIQSNRVIQAVAFLIAIILLAGGTIWLRTMLSSRASQPVSEPQPVAPVAQPQEEEETVEPIGPDVEPEKPAQPVDPKSITWETYTHPDLGFSVKYSKGWTLQSHRVDKLNLSGRVGIWSLEVEQGSPLPPEFYKIEIFRVPPQTLEKAGFPGSSIQEIEEWSIARLREGALETDLPVQIVSREPVTIDGVSTVKIKVVWFPGGKEGIVLHVPVGDEIYSISAGPTSSIYHSLLDEILASIDFKDR